MRVYCKYVFEVMYSSCVRTYKTSIKYIYDVVRCIIYMILPSVFTIINGVRGFYYAYITYIVRPQSTQT